MSYDLTMFRVPDGQDASLAYHQLIEQEEAEFIDLDSWRKRSISESGRAEMRRVADALLRWRPTLEEFRPTSPRPCIELTDEDLMVQIHVHDGTAGITMPYFRDRAQEMMECVTGCIETLKAAAGSSAYDPQLGRVVTSADLEEMVTQYRWMDGNLPAMLGHNPKSTANPKKPWWKIW